MVSPQIRLPGLDLLPLFVTVGDKKHRPLDRFSWISDSDAPPFRTISN
jgi:hypothetical protein